MSDLREVTWEPEAAPTVIDILAMLRETYTPRDSVRLLHSRREGLDTQEGRAEVYAWAERLVDGDPA